MARKRVEPELNGQRSKDEKHFYISHQFLRYDQKIEGEIQSISVDEAKTELHCVVVRRQFAPVANGTGVAGDSTCRPLIWRAGR
jgi:hypothetical protein